VKYELSDGIFVTEDTREVADNVFFLKTKLNERYLDRLKGNVTIINSKDLIKAWGLDELKVVGITGTNGKTTTAAAIYSILTDLDEISALQGTRGFFVDDEQIKPKSLTTPTLLQTLHNMKVAKAKGAKYFIMEVSSHAIDQDRIEGIDFSLKVFTNLTQDHLDYHKSMQEYARVKSQFFMDESLKLLNKDEIKKIEFNPTKAYTYSLDEPSSFKVEAFSLNSGITAVINHLGEIATFKSSLVGLFNVYNLTAAVASVKLLTQKPLQEICDMVEYFGGVSGRMEVVSREPLIIVDFAHTPDGILKVLDSIKDRDIAVVFGAGGDRDKDKRAKMGLAAARYAKKIYITSDNPRSEKPEDIIEDIAKPIAKKDGVVKIVDREEAIKRAIDELNDNEVLLILGKGDEDYIEINGKKIPYSDKEVVKRYLKLN